MNQTTIFLNEEDARLFLLYQKHYLFMKLLESVGAFDLKSGSITIHFTNTGEIGSVDVQRHLKML